METKNLELRIDPTPDGLYWQVYHSEEKRLLVHRASEVFPGAGFQLRFFLDSGGEVYSFPHGSWPETTRLFARR